MHVGQETEVGALGNASHCFCFSGQKETRPSPYREDDSGANGDLCRENM